MLKGRQQDIGIGKKGRLHGPVRERLPGGELRADVGGRAQLDLVGAFGGVHAGRARLAGECVPSGTVSKKTDDLISMA
jgi:hypothetical protein